MSKHNPTGRLSLVVATALVACATAVHAAPGEGRFPISIAEAEAKAVEHFNRVDADASGTVDFSEFEAAPPARDGDRRKRMHQRGEHGGGKHARRMHHEGGPHGEQRKALRAAVEKELFALLDADDNGSLSEAEYAARTRELVRTARRTAMFKRLDANGDNLLTQDEMGSRLQRLKSADADNDGVVTRGEMRAAMVARHQAG